MALHIRDDKALQLARKLAAARGTTMTQAVVEALERALADEQRPLRERLADIAREARQRGDLARGRAVDKAEIDALWGHEAGMAVPTPTLPRERGRERTADDGPLQLNPKRP
jgi:antitoxin VapB